MNKQFVTKDIAFKLKALGFDEPCIGFYKLNMDGLYYDSIMQAFDISFRRNSDLNFFSDITPRATAALWSQAIDWLRDKHNLHISILPNLKFNTELGEELPEDLTYRVIFDNRFYLTYSDNKIPVLCFDNYRGYRFSSDSEAREIAIIKALEIVTSTVN